MKTVYFKELINASPNEVHKIMLNRAEYKKWTIPFSPTSDFNGTWEEGSKIFFTSKDDEGLEAGMISMIDKNIPGEIVIIRHIGMFNHQGELYEGKFIDDWKNSLEVYRFIKSDTKTELICSVELSDQVDPDMFDKSWPEALKILKSLCEKK